MEHFLGSLAGLALLIPMAVVLVRWSGRGDLGQLALLSALAAAFVGMIARVGWIVFVRLRSLKQIARELVDHAQRGGVSTWSADQALALFTAYELREATNLPQHSNALVRAYVEEIARQSERQAMAHAWPRLRWRRRTAYACAGVLALVTEVVLAPPLREGVSWLVLGVDRSPPPPDRQLWNTLELALEFPDHVGRPARIVSNPSGALRVPAGTRVSLRLTTSETARNLALEVGGQNLDDATERQLQKLILISAGHGERETWGAEFLVRAPGSWRLVLDEGHRPTHSSNFELEIESDLPPEVEILPLEAREKITKTTETVAIKYRAKDDFGLLRATFYVLLPTGETLERPLPAPQGREVEAAYAWNLSELPIEARSELEYWIEVRDNDPGLGSTPLLDGPGKIGLSARLRLPVDDAELTHAQNLKNLQQLRAMAVDLLAARLVGPANRKAKLKLPEQTRQRIADIRELMLAHESFLAALAQAVEILAMDSLAGPRATRTLREIHERLLPLFREDNNELAKIPFGREDEADGAKLLVIRLAKKFLSNNVKQIAQLEDEIIRIDDLVDGQFLAQIEALVARVTAGQTRLVELLAQLQSGDESVRPAIDQVQQRLNLDMRKLNEARRALSKELGQEFLNQDAFRILEARMRHLALEKRLREGDVDGALQEAKETLEKMRQLQGEVQDRLSQEGEESPLSPEERQRAELLRELTRLLEDQKRAIEEGGAVHAKWEPIAKAAKIEGTDPVGTKADEWLESLKKVNDATFGREARDALADAKDALQRLGAGNAADKGGANDGEAAAPAEDALTRYRLAAQAAAQLRASQNGIDDKDRGKALIERTTSQLDRMVEELESQLPDPRKTLDGPDQEALNEVTKRQGGLSERSSFIGKQPYAGIFPPHGRQALEDAQKAMKESQRELGEGSLEIAKFRQSHAVAKVKEAIDSLRDNPPPPPPPPSSSSDASTQAEQDRSLRQKIMDVMREGKANEKGQDVTRFYEEILR
jgi:hypothetical protein